MNAKPVFIAMLCLILAASLAGCGQPAPILVGLAVELTGKQADVGINIRDAALLAVEAVNQQGGVNGHKLELLIRDDQGNPDIARQVDAELVKAGVVAIIGHYTSGQTAAVFDQMNQAHKLLISPSATSSDFSGKADYFFRLMPDNGVASQALADYMYDVRGVRKLAGVYDFNNRSYAETFWNTAQEQFQKRGGSIAAGISFKSGETDLQELVKQIKPLEADGFLMVASAVDTARLSQYARQEGITARLFAATWAQTAQLPEKGGQAVNGLEICTTSNPNDQSPAYQTFLKQFVDKYGRPPLLATTQSYETILVLAHALAQTGGKEQGLSAALIAIQNFPGIQGTISFDEFGDVSRDVYIVQVQDGKFFTIKTISPTVR